MNLSIEDIKIGQAFRHIKLKTISEVTDKTTNSVELLNKTDPNNRYESGEKDADGVPQLSGKRKGIDGKNWYIIQDFNKLFEL